MLLLTVFPHYFGLNRKTFYYLCDTPIGLVTPLTSVMKLSLYYLHLTILMPASICVVIAFQRVQRISACPLQPRHSIVHVILLREFRLLAREVFPLQSKERMVSNCNRRHL